MKIKEGELLKNHTTMRTGGPALFFIEAKNERNIIEALEFVNSKKLNFFILGGGSNILVSDKGFYGVVIKIMNKGISYSEYNSSKKSILVKAGAGESWDDLTANTIKHGLVGLENLSAIPGTVGASAVQNIGAYGKEVKDFIYSVEAIDSRDLQKRVFSKEECCFAYRDSFFKSREGKHFIILNVTFCLPKFLNEKDLDIEYKDVKEFISLKKIKNNSKRINSSFVRKVIIEIRRNKLPDLKVFGTAGSFFKNPIIPKKDYERLIKKYPDLPGFSVKFEDDSEQNIKIPLGFVLDKICKLKGYKQGKVSTYEKQALVIVNKDASAKEVENFAKYIEDTVLKKTGIIIEREVESV